MYERKVATPGVVVELKLTASERAAFLDSSRFIDEAFFERIRRTPAGGPVRYTLEELFSLSPYVRWSAEYADSTKSRAKLACVSEKILALLSTEIDESELGNVFDSLDEDDARDSPLGFSLTETVSRVRLTQAQRKTLLAMDTISGDIHKMIDVASKGEQTFEFNARQTLVVGTAIAEAVEQEPAPGRCRQFERIADRLNQGMVELPSEAEGVGPPRVGRQPTPSESTLGYRLKITLEQSHPAIWRDLEVVDCTLGALHELIQIAMGWENYHLHAFKVGERLFGLPEMDETIDESSMRISELLQQGVKEFRYWYDFGDDWWHTIKIEKEFQTKSDEHYPRCTAGARACPPEDIGGVWGYEAFLEAIANPKDQRHEELIECFGDEFDAEQFDVDEINAILLRDTGQGFS